MADNLRPTDGALISIAELARELQCSATVICRLIRLGRLSSDQAPHPLRPSRRLIVFADLHGWHDAEPVDRIHPAATPDQRLVRQVCRAISTSASSLLF